MSVASNRTFQIADRFQPVATVLWLTLMDRNEFR
jgi:hypothetical protein